MKKVCLILSFCAMGAFAETWTGTISDSKCAAKHLDASEKSMKCVQACVKGGASPVFVTSDGKVLKIKDPAKVSEHLGHKVTVNGSVEGDTVDIDSVEMAK